MRSQEWLDYYRSLRDQDFTVVDLETTGSHRDTARVIEVSILQGNLKHGLQHQETHLIDPGIPVPPKISQFTGITQAMLATARSPLSVWTQCLPLLGAGVLTAHNLSFDYGFIQREYLRLGVNYQRPLNSQLCTVQLSRLLLADLPSRSLPNLVKHFQLPIDTSHRAAPDTLACWLLVEILFDRLFNFPNEQELVLTFARQWVDQGEAAEILGCSPQDVEAILTDSPVKQRYSRSRRAMVYLRGHLELLHPGEG